MDNKYVREVFEKQKTCELIKLSYEQPVDGPYKFFTMFTIPMISVKNVKNIMKTQVKLKHRGDLITLKYSQIKEIELKPLRHNRI